MTLSELIKHVGDENVQFQMLAESMMAANQGIKGVTKITFATNAVSALELSVGSEKFVGMIVWLPKERMPKL